jgi:hypothetical protein
MAIGNKISILRLAALKSAFDGSATREPICPLCGIRIGDDVTFEGNGDTQTFTGDMVKMDIAHIVSEMVGGKFTLDNLFPAHKICNQLMSALNLKVYCGRFGSVWSYTRIIETAMAAQKLGDESVLRAKKKVSLDSNIAKITLAILGESKDYQNRTPESVSELCRVST